MENLFEAFAHQEDESPLDDTHIVHVLLYYSADEAEMFKKMCKAAMKKMEPQNFIKFNQSDLLLKLLYAYLDSPAHNDGRASGKIIQDLPEPQSTCADADN
jgi:hypothetical protein